MGGTFFPPLETKASIQASFPHPPFILTKHLGPKAQHAAEMTEVLQLSDTSQQARAENPMGCCDVRAPAVREVAGHLLTATTRSSPTSIRKHAAP